MKHLIIYIVIFCCLGSNFAWAVDNHPESITGHVVSVSETDQGADTDSNHDDSQHDHFCCHGAAHLIGFGAEPIAFSTMSHDRVVTPYSNNLNIYFPALPGKPPRV